MALLANDKLLAVAFHKTIFVYDFSSRSCSIINLLKDKETSSDKSTEKFDNDASHVPTISCSKSHKFLSITDESKSLYIYNTNDWSLVNTRAIPKRCTSMVFTKDDSAVLLADKSGDVNSFPVEDSLKGHLLVVGHISMLIDLVLCKNDNFLITCDRDEKIRVSRYPNSYNISTFCLGHLDFVSQLVYAEDKEVLLSGSGDGTVKLWNYMTGQEISSFDCLPHVDPLKNVKCPNLVPNQSDADNVCRGVDLKNISYQSGDGFVATSFERRSDVLILELKDGKLEFVGRLEMQGNVLDLKFCNGFLFILHLTSDATNLFLSCYKITQGLAFKAQPLKDVVDLSVVTVLAEGVNALNDKLLTFQSEVSKVTDWSKFNCSLHKMHIDNMSEYVDRKRQRMEGVDAKKMKKQKTEVDG